MPIDAKQLVHIERTHLFWQQFFNEERLVAFDEVTAPGSYRHNGSVKDGTGLKAWAEALQKDFHLNVEIERTIPDGNRVAIYWVARPIRKSDKRKQPSVHGMNVLAFDEEGRITENWNCIGGLL